MSRNVSQYFNQINSKAEQRLIEDLIIESIRICGMKVYYIPRTLVDLDTILGEDPMSSFTKTYPIEMYFNTPEGWDSQMDFISKLGLDMPDQTNFICSRRRFVQAVRYDGSNALPQTTFTQNANYINEQQTQYTANEVRPNEGDLIYLPVTNDLFEISRADHEGVFHQLGALYVWRIFVQKFRYASETIQTGVPQIDRIQTVFDNNDQTSQDPIADNNEIRDEAASDLVFTELNPFGEPDGYTGPMVTQENTFQDDEGFQ